MIPSLLYLIVVLGIQTSPQAVWDRTEPCGPWTAICDAALAHYGLDGDEIVGQAIQFPGDGLDGTEWLSRREVFGWVSWCESRHAPFARGDPDDFGVFHSRGLWQYSDVYQPDVSDALAFSPWASTYRAARDWAAGNAGWWTCYRIMQGRT